MGRGEKSSEAPTLSGDLPGWQALPSVRGGVVGGGHAFVAAANLRFPLESVSLNCAPTRLSGGTGEVGGVTGTGADVSSGTPEKGET